MNRAHIIAAILAGAIAVGMATEYEFGRSRISPGARQQEGLSSKVDSSIVGNLALWNEYNFNNGSIVYDLSGNNNTGTVSGATWTADGRGGYFDFDGSNDKIEIPATTTLNFTGNMTLSAWIYPDNVGEGGAGRIFQRAGTGGYGWTLIATNRMLFYAGGGNLAYSKHNAVTYGQWQHVAVTRTGSAVKFYVNGVQAGTSVVATISSESVVATIGSNVDTTRVFDGKIDSFRALSVALTSNQVYKIYHGKRQ